MIYDLWFMIYDSWFMIHDSWFMIYDSWFMIHDDSWFMVEVEKNDYYSQLIANNRIFHENSINRVKSSVSIGALEVKHEIMTDQQTDENEVS